MSIVCERVDYSVKALYHSIMSSDPVDMITQKRTRFTIRKKNHVRVSWIAYAFESPCPQGHLTSCNDTRLWQSKPTRHTQSTVTESQSFSSHRFQNHKVLVSYYRNCSSTHFPQSRNIHPSEQKLPRLLANAQVKTPIVHRWRTPKERIPLARLQSRSL